jgi:hypothetical protein
LKDLLSELMQARFRVLGGAMDEAQQHIAEALELLDDRLGGCGPKPSVLRAARGYVTDAHFFLKNGHSDRAVAAIGSALDAIQPKPEGE